MGEKKQWILGKKWEKNSGRGENGERGRGRGMERMYGMG